jgi:predicted small secreted protein|tara:strand:+ start:646 stop:816 length:171 start_codon:yes stop_codon:yes gene_type:complete
MQMEMLNSKTLKHAFLVLILAASFGTLGGCATVEGAGKDIQSAGEAIEEGAEEASN